MSNFTTTVTVIFEQVEPQFRAAEVQKYRDQAQHQLDGWLAELESGQPLRRDGFYRPYVKSDRYFGWHIPVETLRTYKYEANFERAEADANMAVDQAKAHFINKLSKKLSNATKLHKGTFKVEGTLELQGLVVGTMTVAYKNGDFFRLGMKIITNYRYTRGFVSFYQFPATFNSGQVRGKQFGRVSEKWMSENFK